MLSRARSEDQLERQLQDYLVMRQHVAAFDTELQQQLESFDDTLGKDFRLKLATLLVFDFEAAVCLKQWSDLREIVGKANLCQDELAFKGMADCLLRTADAPSESRWHRGGLRMGNPS
jgi:hypothetical protein